MLVEESKRKEKWIKRGNTRSIKGLKGGHSGTDIDKNRVNALKVVARILAYLPCDQFLLKSISGGHKDNVIPNEAHVEFVVQPGDCKAFKNLLKQTCDMVCEENKSVEPQMYVDMMEEELDTHNVIIQGFYSKIFYYLTYVPNGVQVMSGDIEGMVESSCNLGIFNTEKSKVFATVSMRSQKKTYKEYLNKKLEGMAEMMGASYETSGAYPGWDMNSQSKFRE